MKVHLADSPKLLYEPEYQGSPADIDSWQRFVGYFWCEEANSPSWAGGATYIDPKKTNYLLAHAAEYVGGWCAWWLAPELTSGPYYQDYVFVTDELDKVTCETCKKSWKKIEKDLEDQFGLDM